MPPTLLDLVRDYRKKLDALEKEVRFLINHDDFTRLPETANGPEMRANIMLSFRHLEDARMRLGKVIQAREGGESVYDKA